MKSAFERISPEEYIRQLIERVDAAEERVYIMTLVIAGGPHTDDLIDALCRAAERGVDVRIASDLFFTYKEVSSTISVKRIRTTIALIRTIRKRLRDAGAQFTWLGTKRGLAMFAYITHCKWSIVDDVTFTFGGVNIYTAGITHADYMFTKTDRELADILCKEHIDIVKYDSAGKGTRNHEYEIPSGRILVDGGLSAPSLIYYRACQYAKQSRSVTYVSQYCPSGALSKKLHLVPSTLYFNDWRKAHSFHRWLIRWNVFRQGHTTRYTREDYLHAKCIIFTLLDGTEVAITGSHNFISGNGWFGAREIALETKDPAIIKQLKQFIKKEVASE